MRKRLFLFAILSFLIGVVALYGSAIPIATAGGNGENLIPYFLITGSIFALFLGLPLYWFAFRKYIPFRRALMWFVPFFCLPYLLIYLNQAIPQWYHRYKVIKHQESIEEFTAHTSIETINLTPVYYPVLSEAPVAMELSVVLTHPDADKARKEMGVRLYTPHFDLPMLYQVPPVAQSYNSRNIPHTHDTLKGFPFTVTVNGRSENFDRAVMLKSEMARPQEPQIWSGLVGTKSTLIYRYSADGAYMLAEGRLVCRVADNPSSYSPHQRRIDIPEVLANEPETLFVFESGLLSKKLQEKAEQTKGFTLFDRALWVQLYNVINPAYLKARGYRTCVHEATKDAQGWIKNAYPPNCYCKDVDETQFRVVYRE